MEFVLHLSIDDWRGVAMERRENDGDGVSFSALRVFLRATSYFFTVADTNAGPNSSTNASYHYVNSRPSRPVQRQRRESEEAETAAAIQGGVFATLERLNVLRLTQRGGRDPCNTLVPRSSGKNNGRRGKWDINKSVFARRKRESECASLNAGASWTPTACAADWKQCKIDRFVKDPIRRREVEVSVTRWYRTVCNAYRRYCGHNVLMNLAPLGSLTPAAAMQLQNDVTCVPWPGYTEFLSEAKILDEYPSTARCPTWRMCLWLQTLSSRKRPRKKTIRTAVSLDLNSWNVLSESPRTNTSEVRVSLIENIQPVASEDANEFRSRFLYTEEVSDAFTEHITLLQELYDANMGKYCKPGEKKGMHLVEFLVLL
ncbi:hypothetical protein GQ600_5258 [Phytophthora cactorum]|nr:hypothetical protein GQ600_5258 [Phytophthora cactorum]